MEGMEKIPTLQTGGVSEFASKSFGVNEKYIREVNKLKKAGKIDNEEG